MFFVFERARESKAERESGRTKRNERERREESFT
jgi:hypothetical protein